MKPIISRLLLMLCALLGVAGVSANSATPYFSIRSQGVNIVRDLVGWQEFINLGDKESWYGALSLIGEYDQSFRSANIARCLFGDDVCNGCGTQLSISGSRATDRGANDWLADYFGLSPNFKSTIDIKPRIKNVIIDPNFYFGLDELVQGLYLKINFPIVWTRWDLQARETNINVGSLPYYSGYFSDGPILQEAAVTGIPNLLTSASQFLSGEFAPTIVSASTGTQAVFHKLAASKWSIDCSCKGLTKTSLAAVNAALGYNFVRADNYLFGANLRVSGPTGNKPRGIFLFEPIAGNGGHWEFGVGFSGHYIRHSQDNDHYWGIYFDANITHLFSTCQERSFDLCGKPNSRYMLAERLTTAINHDLRGDPTAEDLTPADLTPSTYQFANEYAPVANLTRTTVTVSAAIQGDAAVKFTYGNDNGFSWDLGYNFWGRSCEKICQRKNGCKRTAFGTQNWALKGDAHVYGFAQTTGGNTPVALDATQSLADIHKGTNGFVPGNDTVQANITAEENPGIDAPQFAVSGPNGLDTELDATPGGTTTQTRTSIQSALLSDAHINFSGTKRISHKIFSHWNYSWLDRDDCKTPFLGFGISVEVSPSDCSDSCSSSSSKPTQLVNCNKGNDCSSSCNSNTDCKRCGVSQWGVWLKGGLAY